MLDYFRSALQSIWSNKVRSFLNILGVIIGVSSVTILIALGQGLKNDVSGLIQGFGTNVLTVIAGKIDKGNLNQNSTNPANFISGDVLTMADIDTIRSNEKVAEVAPGGIVPGTLKYGDKSVAPTLFGTDPNFLKIFEALQIDKGQMFATRDAGHVIVLGVDITDALFPDTDPIGKKVMIGSKEFEVIGTLKNKDGQTSVFGGEFDMFSLIPFDTATELNKGQQKILRIMIKAKSDVKVETVQEELTQAIKQNHNGEEDFTVLTQKDLLGLFNTFLDLATSMVTGIAAISLLVGGLGIMNIMLVTVTERTREIGLRKAVGATKLAILWQFLIEAIVVTFIGSLLGLAIAMVVAVVVEAKTELHPAITSDIIAIAVGISVAVGVIFGLWPAIRAAQKDPIEALRYE